MGQAHIPPRVTCDGIWAFLMSKSTQAAMLGVFAAWSSSVDNLADPRRAYLFYGGGMIVLHC